MSIESVINFVAENVSNPEIRGVAGLFLTLGGCWAANYPEAAIAVITLGLSCMAESTISMGMRDTSENATIMEL